MRPIRDALDLNRDKLPNPSTLCKAMDRLTMALCRRLLQRTTMLQELGEIQAIDAFGFDRIPAGRKYAKRTDYTFQAMKTTILVDCESSAILDVHCSNKQPHDTHVGWQVLTRNLDQFDIVAGEKGYDWSDLCQCLRDSGVRPVIKHRVFNQVNLVQNARQDEEVYHRRSIVESVFATFEQRYGDRLTARSWDGQFRKLALKAAVKNIGSGIGDSHP